MEKLKAKKTTNKYQHHTTFTVITTGCITTRKSNLLKCVVLQYFNVFGKEYSKIKPGKMFVYLKYIYV